MLLFIILCVQTRICPGLAAVEVVVSLNHYHGYVTRWEEKKSELVFVNTTSLSLSLIIVLASFSPYLKW